MRILIAGIGNIFLGDDAFGVQLARRLSSRALPPEVKVVDFGIRGLDLAYAMLDGYDLTILLDATPHDGIPGDLYVIECDLSGAQTDDGMDPHAMNPVRVLQFAKTLGAELKTVLLVGCEPLKLEPDESGFNLSPPVANALEVAVGLVESLVSKTLNETEVKEMTL